MSAMASQVTIVYSTVYSGADQRKHHAYGEQHYEVKLFFFKMTRRFGGYM